MGLPINVGVLMREWVRSHSIVGPTLTLGVQVLEFTRGSFAAAIAQDTPHDPDTRMRAETVLDRLACGKA